VEASAGWLSLSWGGGCEPSRGIESRVPGHDDMARCGDSPRMRRIVRFEHKLDSQPADLQGQPRPSHYSMLTRIC
jgi:hypothetical protein